MGMELVYFILVAIALYVISDWIINLIERRRGERLEHRSLLFFVVILVLTVASFNAIQYLSTDDIPQGAEATDTDSPN